MYLPFQSEDEEMEVLNKKEDDKFKVTDLDSANWVFKKLKQINEKVDQVKSLASKERMRIDEWEKEELGKYEDSINYFNMLLEEYYKEQLKEDKNYKLSTPYGLVSKRKLQPKYNYKKDEEIAEELKRVGRHNLIEVIPKVNKNELKKEIKVLEDVYLIDNQLLDYELMGDTLIIKETGEVIWLDDERITFHETLAVIEDIPLESVEIEKREEKINIKVR